jgi:MYXO-CTERM domain-containing protein
MQRAVLFAMTFLVLLPPADATPLYNVWFPTDAEENGVTFTHLGASGTDDIARHVYVDGRRVYAEYCPQPPGQGGCDDIFMHVEWSAGPLLGIERYAPYGYGLLTYGPGTLRVIGGLLPAPAQVLAEVELERLVIDLRGPDARGYFGDATATLGRGWLDPLLAAFLGTPQHVLSGTWQMGIDYVEIREFPDLRGWGGDNYGRGLDLVVTAPEPADTWLALLGLGAALARRRSACRG